MFLRQFCQSFPPLSHLTLKISHIMSSTDMIQMTHKKHLCCQESHNHPSSVIENFNYFLNNLTLNRITTIEGFFQFTQPFV